MENFSANRQSKKCLVDLASSGRIRGASGGIWRRAVKLVFCRANLASREPKKNFNLASSGRISRASVESGVEMSN